MNDNIDITTNEVLNVKLDYITKDIAVIKSDVKEIKSDFISRREFETQLHDLTDKTTVMARDLDKKTDTRFKTTEYQLKNLYSLVYWIGGLLGATFLTAIAKLILK